MARTTKTGMYMLATAARDAGALVAASRGPSSNSPPAQAVGRLLYVYQYMSLGKTHRAFLWYEKEEAAAFALLVKYRYVMPADAQDRSAGSLPKRAGRRID